MLDALLITRMQDEMTAALHETQEELAIEAGADGLMAIAMAQHRANFELWHEEDNARVPGVADAEIVRVKHAIDGLNQNRNDLVEKMDAWLMERLDQDAGAALHSILAETIETNRGRAVIVGIGINLTSDSFPPELDQVATSLPSTLRIRSK